MTSASVSPSLRDPVALCLLLSAVMMITANNAISPALPGLEAQFADNPNAPALTRLLVSAPSLSVAILAPFAGKLVDRFGRRHLLLAGICLFGATGAAGGVLPSLELILTARLAQGVALAMIITAQSALVGDLFQGDDRNRFSGLQIAVRNYGGLLFIFAAGGLATVSPRLPFMIYVGAVLCLPLFLRHLPLTTTLQAKRLEGAPSDTSWPVIIGLSALQSVATALFFLMPTQIPFFLGELSYAPELTTPWVLGILMLTGGPAALSYARLVNRIGQGGGLAIGFTLLAAGFAALSIANTLPLVMAGASLIGAGYGVVTPGFVPMLLAATSAEQRGLATGILGTGLYLGQVVSPLISQPVIAEFGWAIAFGGTSILLMILAAMALFLIRQT